MKIHHIEIDNKIYNIVVNHDTQMIDINSYLKGGIVISEQKIKPEKTQFPNNILMESDYDVSNFPYDISNSIYYDTIWTRNGNSFTHKGTTIDISNIPAIKYEVVITKDIIDKIRQMQICANNIIKLYKTDDYVLKTQWFMDYVSFDEFAETESTDREKRISDNIRKIHTLSKDFNINNNHQMKLLFEILFNSKAEGKSNYYTYINSLNIYE
jgi:hypothetical protein